MGHRFVDQIWIKQRMDRKDARMAREARAQQRRLTIPSICGWCPDKEARTAAAMAANGGRPVSHGICAECTARLEKE